MKPDGLSKYPLGKSKKPFLRIEIESDTPEVYFRPYNQPMPGRIVIINGLQDYWTGFTPGYKRFKNVTIQTQGSFRTNYLRDFQSTTWGQFLYKSRIVSV